MSESVNEASPLPAARLGAMIGGARATQLVYVAAKLGIADLLKDGPKGSDELARAVLAHPGTLNRVLRALTALGVFAETEDGRFELTPLAEPLQSDVTGSMRDFAIMYGEDWFWRPYGALLHSVRTGETPFEHVHGEGVFEYLDREPEAARVFNDAMTSLSGPHAATVVAAYDFSGISKIVDLGGGHGSLIAAILKANPNMRGVLYDRPSVVAGARDLLNAEGVAHRCELVAGDFFQSVPAGGDAYILKWIIHDFQDDRSVEILKNCRRAMADVGKLLLVERVVPRGKDGRSEKLADITMLAIPGGLERTEAQFSSLLRAAGFRLVRIVPTQTEMNVIEAVPI
jgi:hypothetical protein